MNVIHEVCEHRRMLEIRHLRSLIALADAGTLSRAADRVHLTQSALSHQLRVLEEHYGTRIVERDGRRLKLTRPGGSRSSG